MHLYELQREHKEWQQREFPDQEPFDAVLGVVEEVGELAHSVLKAKQGIRGTELEHKAKEMDSIGDIVIFLASHCNVRGLDLNECVMMAWAQVKERRWNRDSAAKAN